MNLKTGVTRKQSMPNFLKNKHFLPPVTYTHVCVSRGKNVHFSEILTCLFSCNTHFEIRPFPLLPTIYQTTSPWQLFWICYLSIQIRVRYHQDQFFSIRKKKQTKKQLKRTKQLKTVNSDFRKKHQKRNEKYFICFLY